MVSLSIGPTVRKMKTCSRVLLAPDPGQFLNERLPWLMERDLCRRCRPEPVELKERAGACGFGPRASCLYSIAILPHVAQQEYDRSGCDNSSINATEMGGSISHNVTPAEAPITAAVSGQVSENLLRMATKKI